MQTVEWWGNSVVFFWLLWIFPPQWNEMKSSYGCRILGRGLEFWGIEKCVKCHLGEWKQELSREMYKDCWDLLSPTCKICHHKFRTGPVRTLIVSLQPHWDTVVLRQRYQESGLSRVGVCHVKVTRVVLSKILKMFLQDSHPLVILSDTNLCPTVKRLCRCN